MVVGVEVVVVVELVVVVVVVGQLVDGYEVPN